MRGRVRAPTLAQSHSDPRGMETRTKVKLASQVELIADCAVLYLTRPVEVKSRLNRRGQMIQSIERAESTRLSKMCFLGIQSGNSRG